MALDNERNLQPALRLINLALPDPNERGPKAAFRQNNPFLEKERAQMAQECIGNAVVL